MSEKKLILIVEDEANILNMLKEFLEKYDYRVHTAPDGLQALKEIEQHLPDLVITDLLLPLQHGLEVIRQIKDRFFIPIIAVSGIYEKDDVLKELEDYHIDGFFNKPINLNELKKSISSILNE